jgi:hypothetical protein
MRHVMLAIRRMDRTVGSLPDRCSLTWRKECGPHSALFRDCGAETSSSGPKTKGNSLPILVTYPNLSTGTRGCFDPIGESLTQANQQGFHATVQLFDEWPKPTIDLWD